MKEKAPENSLGVYLTAVNIANVDIYAKTNIPTSDLSRLRSGEILTIPAARLYLISLVTSDSIGIVLKKVYPNLGLKSKQDPAEKTTLTPVGKVMRTLEGYSLEKIAFKTGLELKRLRDLTRKPTTIVAAHELYLIELATETETGALFLELFKDLYLNDSETEERLRIQEREKSSRGKRRN